MAQHNVKNVIWFEVGRTLRKPSFWISTLAMPLLFGVIALISGLSSASAASASESQAEEVFPFEYVDPSGLTDPALMAAAQGTPIDDPAAGIDHVKSGAVDAFIQYPADPATGPILVWGQDIGLFGSSTYSEVAKALLNLSAQQDVGDPALAAVLSGSVETETVTYRDGVETNGFGDAIAPLLYVVVFFLIIILLSNLLLSAFLEEKENRVAEMILSTIPATSLLVGKIVSLTVIGLTQILTLLLPTVLILALTDKLPFDLGGLTFPPQQMIVGAFILLAAFALYMILVVLIGMIVPTQKEAGGFFSAVMLLNLAPLYITPLILSNSDAPIVKVFLFVPFTAGITALACNALGALPLWQGLIIVAELVVTTAAAVWVAARVCQYGLIAYTKRLDVKALLTRKGA
jgi:ABC-2 type transport system permease protein